MLKVVTRDVLQVVMGDVFKTVTRDVLQVAMRDVLQAVMRDLFKAVMCAGRLEANKETSGKANLGEETWEEDTYLYSYLEGARARLPAASQVPEHSGAFVIHLCA